MTSESNRTEQETITNAAPQPSPEQLAAQQEEQKLIRRLQMMMNMVMQVIAQDPSLTVDDASQMIADSKSAALAMFPAKSSPTTLSGSPAFRRLMRERFRIM